MLETNPNLRPSAKELIDHPFITNSDPEYDDK